MFFYGNQCGALQFFVGVFRICEVFHVKFEAKSPQVLEALSKVLAPGSSDLGPNENIEHFILSSSMIPLARAKILTMKTRV